MQFAVYGSGVIRRSHGGIETLPLGLTSADGNRCGEDSVGAFFTCLTLKNGAVEIASILNKEYKYDVRLWVRGQSTRYMHALGNASLSATQTINRDTVMLFALTLSYWKR